LATASARAPRPAIAELAELIGRARSVVALTGAGISVPSGIPDFRSPGSGLWEKVDPMEVAHIDAFRGDPVRFWSFYGERFATLAPSPRGHARAGGGPRQHRQLLVPALRREHGAR